ncbi:hypothetical protein [Amycolatopsis vancoresmycina]|uniref:Uncharacterized protein n=1 Tax=Amycolatopsis vancoresmycina DSM 44592 TaxID=1292037 RepID=R1IBI2_9PSEU|nr:hypothetical protein [Amycolatopsis vancoresmycina]EOD67764.1 hypothetical protein H480_14742 [Amycolatopsis vancoresmycina DSM 44592]
MVSKEQMKAAIHAAFDGAVDGGASYTKVYAAEIRQKNYLIFRTTSVANFALGFRPGQTDLVLVPLEEKNGTVTAGTPLTITDANRASVKKRDLQGRFVIKTTDGRTFRLSILPSVTKLLAAAYQLPVEQKAEYEAFTALRDSLLTA